MRLFIWFFSLLISSWVFSAQGTVASELPHHVSFKHILPNQIASIGDVQSIAQDKEGFVWFGGGGGLVKFDGYQLYHYEIDGTGRQTGLASKYITHIFLDSLDNLWVSTAAGVHLYDPALDRFDSVAKRLNSDTWRVSDQVNHIAENRDGMFWLASPTGLYQFDPTSFESKKIEFPLKPGLTVRHYLNVVLTDQYGHVWIGSRDQGLFRYDPVNASWKQFKHNPDDASSISGNNINTLFFDSQNVLWVGTRRNGINRMNPDGETFTHVKLNLTSNQADARQFAEDGQGRLWVVGDFGTLVFDQARQHFRHFVHSDQDPSSMWSDVVRTIFLDRAGDAWLGYYPSGVDLRDRQTAMFKNFYPSTKNRGSILGGGVRSVHLDKHHQTWIGTGEGLTKIDLNDYSVENYTDDDRSPIKLNGSKILSVEADASGQIWVGYWQQGLDVIDLDKRRVIALDATDVFQKGVLYGDQPWDILKTADGTMWVGTNQGLNRYDTKTQTFEFYRPAPEILESNRRLYIRCLTEDSAGRLWLGTTSGLYWFDRKTGTFRVYREDSQDDRSLGDSFVVSIYEDSNQTLWIGTKGAGLHRMDSLEGRFTRFKEKMDLPYDLISSIVEDDQKNLWLSTQTGLVKYSLVDGALESFDKRKGIPGNLFNRNTLVKAPSGKILGGTTEGFTIFDPSSRQSNDFVPPVVITDFTISNRAVDIGGEASPLRVAPHLLNAITLFPEHSVFTVHFSALNYRQSESNRYVYRLKGFDQTWQQAQSNRSATYTNLDAGSYVFEVKGANNDGVWNQIPRTIDIRILPPLWRTWWAYSAYVILVVSFVFFVMMYVWKKQAYVREKKLNASLKNLDKLKDELLANTSHELRTPLNGMVGLAEVMLTEIERGAEKEKLKDLVEMILFSGMRLSKLVDDILDFSKLKTHKLELKKQRVPLKSFAGEMLRLISPLVKGKEVLLENVIQNEAWAIYADEQRLQQIFFNLLGNAIKFTYEGKVTVGAKLSGDHIVISVSDSGVGISSEDLERIFESYEQVSNPETEPFQGTGLGLAITKKLVDLHGGKIEVASEVGKGTTFYLYFQNADCSNLNLSGG